MKPFLLKSIIILIVFFVVGYIREDTFVSINNILSFQLEQIKLPAHYNSFIYKLFQNQSYWWLYKFKWILTLFFSGIYFSLTILFNKWLFKVNLIKSLAVIYIFFILFSGLLMVIGYLKQDFEITYKITRAIMGFAQSPLLFITSVPFVWQLKHKEQKE